MSEVLDLTKKLDLRKQKVLDLKKSIGLENQKAQVVLALDYSGSMSNLYTTGQVQDLVERILPLGMAFDDNGEVDFYIFQNSHTKLPENLTVANVPGYINAKVYKKFPMGGTSYAPIIKAITKDFAKKGGFLGTGGYKKMDLPVYVIFVTDGENDDKIEAEAAITESSKAGIFFQFVGIGSENFRFLKKLDSMPGRNIDNANFFSVKDLAGKTDDELYGLLLVEFPSYVREAKSKGLIK